MLTHRCARATLPDRGLFAMPRQPAAIEVSRPSVVDRWLTVYDMYCAVFRDSFDDGAVFCTKYTLLHSHGAVLVEVGARSKGAGRWARDGSIGGNWNWDGLRRVCAHVATLLADFFWKSLRLSREKQVTSRSPLCS